MKNGHIELGEILFVALLIIGLAAAAFIFIGPKPAYPSVPGNLSENGSDEPQDRTMPAAENQTLPTQPEPQPVQAAPPLANGTMGSILDEGLSRADSLFYSRVESGQYEIKTYKWTMGKLNDLPDSIQIKANDIRAVDVRFDGRYSDSLRGFAFRVYSYSGYSSPSKIYGVAAFISDSNPLEGMNASVDVQYDLAPEGAQIIEGCSVLSASEYGTAAGTPLHVYDIECKVMYGANP
ncbi:MAG: hypothetical protein WC551_12095 [Patescibacteria group bacterium]